MTSAASTEPKISTLLSSEEEPLYASTKAPETNELSDTTQSCKKQATEHAPKNADNLCLKSQKPRRVKVYLLRGDDWLDNGTGYCMGEVEAASQKPCFVVRNELDDQDVILRSFLEGSIQYQRQQETLIVWTDLTGKDLALSFQENDGCADLCDFIVRAQQNNLSPSISLYYVLTSMQNSGPTEGPREITELITGPISYPPLVPARDSLPATLDLLTQGGNSMFSRFKISTFIVDNHYFDKFFDLFSELEAAHDLEGLHLINDIIKIALYYNEPKIVDELVSSETRAMGFAGILEYDRSHPNHRACHREYLQDETRLKMVVEIPLPTCGAEEQMDIFRKDFVLQYLRNVALPQNSEESALNLLGSMVHNNQVEIIEYLQDSQANNNFLHRLFGLYDMTSMSSSKQRCDGVRLVHQYVLVAKTFSSGQSSDFFNELVKRGLLKLVKYALNESERQLRVIGVEILTTVIDQDIALVSLVSNGNKEVDEFEEADPIKEEPVSDEHTQENTETIKLNLMNDMSLTLTLGKLLLNDTDPALKIQTFEAIKNLLCSTVFDAEYPSKDDYDSSPYEDERNPEHEAYVKKYFETFYDQVAPMLFGAFSDIASNTESVKSEAERRLKGDPVLFQHLCDLISFCCHEHESAICRPFFTGSRALDGIINALTLNVNVTLKLGILRCIKSFVLLEDCVLGSYMISNNLFAPFFSCFESVAQSDSLINSSCLDLLEVIIKHGSEENFGQLAVYISQRFGQFLETKINYVTTGSELLDVARKFREKAKDNTVTSMDVDQDYSQPCQPSSPVAMRPNEFQAVSNDKPSICNNPENPGSFDDQSKRKRGNCDTNLEKRTRASDRDTCNSTFQNENGVEDEIAFRGMAA